MKVTQVALRPTQASDDARRPALTPELLAATGARYSRSNDGLEAILAKIDPENSDKSIDTIFRFIDYGHQSVADMVPVALFMDGISMWLAYHIWSLCPLAGGQESSTRYLRLSADNLPDAAAIGISAEQQGEWRAAMEGALDAYERALTFWESVAEANPGVTRIPASLLADSSDRARKQVARMKRNYAFDRARYFLPAALLTNVMMVQSARAWVGLCQQLLSHPLPEAQRLGEGIREELALVAPRLIKHAAAQPSLVRGIRRELNDVRGEAEVAFDWEREWPETAEAKPYLWVAEWEDGNDVEERDLEFHDNRYAYIGRSLQMLPVKFAWYGVAFGDIRDLNRHRTGSKNCPLLPLGFYGARDQNPDNETLASLSYIGANISARARDILREQGGASFVYWVLLGTQFYFEHLTTADKFIYEAELRTGVGAHYRYAQHLRDVLELWYQKFPATRGLILEGSAEPE